MFDWTGTLVNEYYLDKKMCDNIEIEISKKRGISFNEAKRKYQNLLTEYGDSWEWYNYPLHGQLFGVDWRKVHSTVLPEIKLIPSACEVLSYFKKKGHFICMLTNAVKEVVEMRIDFLRMRHFFDLIVTSDMVESTKSTGKHLELALETLKISNKQAFMIGDSLTQDIFPAKKLGVVTVQCKFGDATYYHTENHIENIKKSETIPDYIIDDLTELLSIMKD
jgi:FMN phosphatase YigB (HAD superfamily)